MKAKQRIASSAKRKSATPSPRPRHFDMIGADAALKRAARRALDLALRTGTPCWILRGGEMVDLAAEVRGKSRAKALIAGKRRGSPVNQRKAAKQQSAAFDAHAAERAWRAFRRHLGVAPIHTARQYERTVKLMNSLIDVVGQNERHPLAGLLDLVGELVANYESRVLP